MINILNHSYNYLQGWALGHTQGMLEGRRLEFGAGQNDYLVASMQCGQFTAILSLVSLIATKAFVQTTADQVSKVCRRLTWLSIPLFILIGVINSGKYGAFITTCNQLFNTRFGTNVPSPVRSVCELIRDHGGKFFATATFASFVAFVALREYCIAAGLLTAMTYHVLNVNNLLPYRVSLFAERYLRIVTIVMGMMKGFILNRIFMAMLLPTCFSPRIRQVFHERIDQLSRALFRSRLTGYRLEEFNRPISDRKNLPYDEIVRILDTAQRIAVEVDPAHCDKLCLDLSQFPENNRYERLMELWDQRDWAPSVAAIRGKLLDDERFRTAVILAHFQGEVTIEQIDENRSHYFDLMLQQRFGNPPEQQAVGDFVINWTREQLFALVQGLKGEIFVEGRKVDLEDAKEAISKIIPRLDSLAASADHRVEFEDILLKLAIEGGAYCARGKKRAAEELLNSTLMQQYVPSQGEEYNPNQEYETNLRTALLAKRREILGQSYENFTTTTLTIPDFLRNDVHGFDNYGGHSLSRGFVPMSSYQLEKWDVSDMIFWECFEERRNAMIASYARDLPAAITEVGMARFSDYLVDLIRRHQTLTQEQKEELIERYQEMAFHAQPDLVELRFKYLVLYMLGVVRIRF